MKKGKLNIDDLKKKKILILDQAQSLIIKGGDGNIVRTVDGDEDSR